MEIIEKSKILTNDGKLKVKGYAKHNIFDFNREQINANRFRIKEWDFYQISSEKFCMQMTIGHVGYMGNINATLLEFSTGKKFTVARMIPLKSHIMESNCEENHILSVSNGGLEMSFDVQGKKRRLTMKCDDKKLGQCEIDVTLTSSGKNGIVVLTPFEKENQFYFNHKLNCMTASGFARFGKNYFEFKPDECFGLLDWGRGVLPFKHTWVWGSASGKIENESFGFNLGEFGDTSNDTENMVYYKGKSYKFGKINMNFDKNDFMKNFSYISDCGNFNLTLTPTFDNYTTTKVLFVNNSCHQVFGKFNGKIVVENEQIDVIDFFGFTEYACNQW